MTEWASREQDIRRRAEIGGNISAKMAREVFAALDEARHFATDYATALNDCRDAARAGVPGDEGLRAEVLAAIDEADVIEDSADVEQARLQAQVVVTRLRAALASPDSERPA